MNPRFREWARGLKMPHTLVIVGGLMALVLVLSWLIPSGEFARLAKALSVRSIRPAVSAPRLIIDGDTHSRADLRKAFRSIKFGS